MGVERLNEFWPEWKIESELGEGAFGKVYKAVNLDAGFPVYSAIKVLSIPSSKSEIDALRSEGMSYSESKTYFKEIADSFINEIKMMETLKGSANIVGVEAFKIVEKQNSVGWDIYIRMELLTSFKEYLAGKTLSEEEVIKLGIDIASALEVCEKENIIHRDIKPANIFVDKYGNFKLGDFGIAKELEKNSVAISSKGTLSYMAPEVAKGLKYGNTVDIYSLGLVLYVLLNNNRPPFVDPYKSEVGYNERKIANDGRLLGEAIPSPINAFPDLSNIILTACSCDPSKRFKSATALKNALKSYKRGRKTDNAPQITHQTDDNVETKFKAVSSIAGNIIQNNAGKRKNIVVLLLIILLISVIIAVMLIIPSLQKSRDPLNTDTIGSEPLINEPVDSETSDESPEIHESETAFVPDEAVVSADINVGDTIAFGSYEQDNDVLNGAEEIKWTVLKTENGKALLISQRVLDCLKYNEKFEAVTWETSDARSWLNDDFYNSAFSEYEKTRIHNTSVINGDNSQFGTDGGNMTGDNIFLLSISEIGEYFSSASMMCCKPTEYAKARGVSSNNENCWWWLRSPGEDSFNAAIIRNTGGIYLKGGYVNNSVNGIRPAMWIAVD